MGSGTIVVVIISAFFLVAVIVVVLRRTRAHPLPCPWWMSILLENPYMNSMAGGAAILDRAGLVPGMRFLDIGCGPGRITIPAAERVGAGGEVVALDVQEKMLEKVKRRIDEHHLSNVRTILSTIAGAELGDDYFDRAILVTVLGEIPNRAEALVKIRSALKPGGLLSITEVIPDPDYLSKKRVRAMCEKAGFTFSGVHGGWVAYTMNFTK
jgi:ubiquinone/menaquinone biosynthesis C-methylase UbiE